MRLLQLFKWCIIFNLFVLTGCWDQNLLKDVRLILAAGYDLDNEGNLITSVEVRRTKGPKTEEESGDEIGTETVVGYTPRHTRDKLNLRLDKRFEPAKLEIIILGEELAKTNVFQLLDVFYRDPKSSLGSNIVVTEGKASKLIEVAESENIRISDYLKDLIESASYASFVEDENIQSVCAELLDPGQDFSLPYVSPDDGRIAGVKGVALFSETSLAGYLEGQEAILYQLLDNHLGRTARFTKKVHHYKGASFENFITIDVKKLKRKLTVDAHNKDDIKVNIKLNISAEVVEYPHNVLNTKEKIEDLNDKLSKEFTKNAEEVISKLQEANSDALAIGRQLISLHPEVWKSMKWRDVYPSISITPQVNITITDTGILH
ncbi:Ger(x)C family spore germination protein [Bacillus lacus]|uniref:Ger(X)C family spore germination protein n=1 Tax=Metabacillus lacus TaxID=1983721 RepID=A0A7X2IZ13_9BACI|nr:Ger(x)C family spore germination protein [Metabacillus lacus]MRX72281.1 Ger(x)C family spore germination protein [Metabacillus lacus]